MGTAAHFDTVYRACEDLFGVNTSDRPYTPIVPDVLLTRHLGAKNCSAAASNCRINDTVLRRATGTFCSKTCRCDALESGSLITGETTGCLPSCFSLALPSSRPCEDVSRDDPVWLTW